MARRRRQTKRKAKPWTATILASAVVHIAVVAGLIALGWRAIDVAQPGSAIAVYVISDGNSSNSASLLRATAKPRLAVAGSPIHSPHHLPSSEQTNRGSAQTKLIENTGSSAGAGGGTGAGIGDNAGSAGNPILAEIRRRIERAKRYPVQAREQHIEGRVGLRFSIQNDGRVSELQVTQSSGSAVLDQAAILAVQHSAPLPHYGFPIDLSLAFRLR